MSLPSHRRWLTAGAFVAPLLVAALGVVLGPLGQPNDAAVVDRGEHGSFAPSGAQNVATVWAVGDGADGGAPGSALAELIERSDPDRFLYLGDVYENGTAREFASNYVTTYGALSGRTAPTVGNHDSGQLLSGYAPYWREATGQTPPSFYSFRVAGWQIVSLNSEIPLDEGSAQLRWLEARLRGPGTCRLAFWHRPLYSAGTVHGDQDDVAPLWSALIGHASLVINGHEHNMQRFAPRDGMTEFVSGAGGHDPYPLDGSDPRLDFGNDSDYGALRLELQPGDARFAFIDADGRTLDAGHVPCETG